MAKRSLSSLPVSELHAELRRRKKRVHTLVRKRNRLVEQIQSLDEQIRAEGGADMVRAGSGSAGGARRGRRPRNGANLADSMVGVLTGKTMGVTELAQAVQAAGYVTTSPNFRTIVNQTLIKDKRFKRVERGQYTVR